MSLSSAFKTVCESVGKDNNPAYAVVAIATAKGICRPMFTMMDKKEAPETKKYTALREGLTEVIAIPTYLACGYLAGKGADLVKDAEKAKKAKHNLRFLGVCTAALVVIPGLCSVFVKPFTDRIFHGSKKDNKDSQPAKLDITSKTEQIDIANKPEAPKTGNIAHTGAYPMQPIASFRNQGMRVG